jgi:hypothetical protein
MSVHGDGGQYLTAATEAGLLPIHSSPTILSWVLPFDIGGQTQTEIHTPEIDGHNFVRHGIRWK